MKLKKSVWIILLLLIIVGLGLYIYFSFFGGSSKHVEKKTIDSIPEYGYTLSDRSTENYKNYFEELKNVLSSADVDEEQYLKLISKMFIIDLYSLDLRIDNNDIGGCEFVYSDVLENYKAKVKDTLYLYLESDLYGKREQDLPIVDDVEVDEVNTVTYYYNDSKEKDEEAYEVQVSWDYTKKSDYQKEAKLYFIHDEKKLSLVEIK